MLSYNVHQAAPSNSFMVDLYLGPNDGVSRGDRADTGDDSAAPDEMGTGDAHSTADPTSFGGNTSIHHPRRSDVDLEEESMDDMEILPADDATLGLTNTDRVPADDWAADTGPTRNADGKRQL